MDINNLEIGKFYTLKYNNPWMDYDIKDIKISGKTVESESGLYGVDSLFSEFFSSYNITISSYVDMMSVTPDVFVCQQILDRTTGEVDDSIILIPKVMIDFGNSEELLLCDNIVITVKGLYKYHELAFNRGTFFNELTKNVKKALKNTEEFGDTLFSVNMENSDTLKSVSEYKKYDDLRTYTFNIQKLATDQEILKHNLDLKKMIEKSIEMDTTISNYSAKVVDLEESISNFNESKIRYDEVSQIVNDNGTLLFSGLESGSILPNSVDYFTLRNAIMDSVVQP